MPHKRKASKVSERIETERRVSEWASLHRAEIVERLRNATNGTADSDGHGERNVERTEPSNTDNDDRSSNAVGWLQFRATAIPPWRRQLYDQDKSERNRDIRETESKEYVIPFSKDSKLVPKPIRFNEPNVMRLRICCFLNPNTKSLFARFFWKAWYTLLDLILVLIPVAILAQANSRQGVLNGEQSFPP